MFITATYTAYAQIEVASLLMGSGRKPEEIKEVAIKWDEAFITFKDGSEITVHCALAEQADLDVKYPASIKVIDNDCALVAENDDSYVTFKDADNA